MSSLTTHSFGIDEHPAGKISVRSGRAVGARARALAGLRGSSFVMLNTIVGSIVAENSPVNSVTEGVAA